MKPTPHPSHNGLWPSELRLSSLAALCLVGLTGCATLASGPELNLTTAVQPQAASWSFKASAQDSGLLNPARSAAGLSLSADNAPSQWWTLFEDPLLTTLQAEAVGGNLDLQTALLRIQESQARLGLTQASALPVLNFDAGYARAGLSADSPLAKLGVPTKPYDQWQWGLQASWELDLWGHHERLTESARAQLAATHWALSAARVTLAADVARSYLLLRGVQAQQRLINEHRTIATELLRLTESRERHGVATQFDSAAARAELATVQARTVQLEQQQDALLSQLALLLGQAPHDLDTRLMGSTHPVPTPIKLPVGVPSDLVRQRPDILQAEALLRAATADKGAAQADFYPRVSLNAGWSLLTSHSGEVTNWDMRQFSVGPVVHLPIFDGGRLKRSLDLTDARQRGAALHWRQTVLKAWHEVASALDSSANEQARQEQLAQAVHFNTEALNSARHAWKAGSAEFTTVLVAQRTLLNAQATLVDSQTASGLAVVALYRALGQGAAEVRPEQLAQVTTRMTPSAEVPR
ncbi:MAG: efflux transporter outer membrane subunit [Curvibacter lanceolatus]|uniref:efflux transporter outer membrane subunit n=1 Tax=Curvibacter lanceolatus TaxID=86182 RepID=UPI00035EF4AB|nr:efflux transporter outer membrane subunit [Curvibacter lanceolatus]MBV5295455.1 efflux transporter outer membrane subunit [Curvibacter lanceolatus]